MSEKVIIAYKQLGETPLECLERVRLEQKIDPSIPMTYAGRLDPMACGLMILLVGEECKKKDKYLGLNKTYEFKILVGFSTDTYDLLGLVSPNTSAKEVFVRSSDLLSDPESAGQTIPNTSFAFALQEVLPKFTGTFIQKYPSFSSKTVGGKQLFQLSKDNELPENLPAHEVTIIKLLCTSTEVLEKEDLQKEIFRRIALVKGDFRQQEIIKRWNEVFNVSKEKEYEIISCVCECSSGTYIRQLVADISEKIKVPLVTYMINRTKVGEYGLD